MTDTVTNWDKLEQEWRFGKQSNVALGKKYKVSESAIRKRAKREGWVKGKKPGPKQPPAPGKALPSTAAPVNDDGKEPLAMTLDLALRMMDELNTTTSAIDELEDLIYKETAGDRDGRRRTAMLRAVSLPTRANTLKLIQQAIVVADTDGKAADGKKAQKKAAANEVASKPGGRFSGSAPPLRAVK